MKLKFNLEGFLLLAEKIEVKWLSYRPKLSEKNAVSFFSSEFMFIFDLMLKLVAII